jgi:hypothetical protein
VGAAAVAGLTRRPRRWRVTLEFSTKI